MVLHPDFHCQPHTPKAFQNTESRSDLIGEGKNGTDKKNKAQWPAAQNIRS
jgi:hypothetical protein